MIVVAIILVILSGLIAAGNIGGTLAALARRRRGGRVGYSNIPVITALFCTIAWLLSRGQFGSWVFLPAVLDPGTWSVVVLPFYLRARSGDRSDTAGSSDYVEGQPAVPTERTEIVPVREFVEYSSQPDSVRVFSLDREGYVGIYTNAAEAETLEWIDVENREYIIIDEHAFVYQPIESSDGLNGYRWRRTRVHNPELLERLRAYDDGARMGRDDLRRSRSDFIGSDVFR